MSDSFRKAQANYDAMEPPEFWADDSHEAFTDAVRAEAIDQLRKCNKARCNLLAEQMTPEAVSLTSDPAAFTAKCLEIIEAGVQSYAKSIVDDVLDFCDMPKWKGSDVDEMVAHAINRMF